MEVQGRRKRGAVCMKDEGGWWEWKYKGGGREELYVGRRVVGMEVQGRRKRGAVCMKEGGGNGSTREEEERKE